MRRILSASFFLCLLFGSIAVLARPAHSASAESLVGLRLSPDELALFDAAGVEAQVRVDYGLYTWVVPQAGQTFPLPASSLVNPAISNPYTLNLAGQDFDPLMQTPAMDPAWQPALDFGPNFHLVQLVGPVKDEWVDTLQASGLEVVQYIHPFTYVVWGTPSELELARAAAAHPTAGLPQGFIRWTGAFAPAYRVPVESQSLDTGLVSARALVLRQAGVDRVSAALQQSGAVVEGRGSVDAAWDVVLITLPASSLAAAASVPGVYTIQPVAQDGGLRGEVSNQINANNLSGGAALPGYRTWLQSIGLSGAGVTLAVVDGGAETTHADLAARFVACTGVTCTGSAVDVSHGTHVAGIMAGDAASGRVDANGFLRGLGMAPGANLVRQYYSPHYYQLAQGVYRLMTDSYRSGAQVSGNSWGPSATPKGYDLDTRLVDIGVRDADPDAAGNQSLVYVVSIMNGNGGTSTQGTPDEGKNLLPVGSTYAQQSPSGLLSPTINNISPNSAHGPALDGRHLPLLVAPGWFVDSTIPTNTYGFKGGTSMASPHTTGSVALFFDYYRQRIGKDPSPAMVKAAFLAVAHNLAGFKDADGFTLGQPLDSKQGWGRMNTAAVVNPQNSVLYFEDPLRFNNTGEQWTWYAQPADPSKPVRIMLAWTDAPGHGLGGSTPAWNNDLDLVVEYTGAIFRGNVFNASTGWSQAGGVADYKNNTEGVFLGPTASGGGFTIRVQAGNINSDGVPGQGDTTDQDFALVCYNCAPISANPQSAAVCQAQPAVYDLYIAQSQFTRAAVSFGVEGQPQNTTAVFSPWVGLPPVRSTLTINTAADTPSGDYTLEVSAINQSSLVTTTLALSVGSVSPAPPVLLSPINDAATGLQPTLSWSPVAAVAQYQLQLSADENFTTLLQDVTVSPSEYTLPVSLEGGQRYYWRVRSLGLCGESPFSAAQSFLSLWPDGDEDGASDVLEDTAPNNGDANADGTPDREQSNVASLPNLPGTHYQTLAVTAPARLRNVEAVTGPVSPLPVNTLFSEGFLSYQVELPEGQYTTTLTLTLHSGGLAHYYWQYAPGYGRTDPGLFIYTYNGSTGAEIMPGLVLLHFEDGGRGDLDGLVNGVVRVYGGLDYGFFRYFLPWIAVSGCSTEDCP